MNTRTRFLLAVAMIPFLTVASCNKAKDLVELLEKSKKPSPGASPSAPAGPLVAEISENEFDTFTRQQGRVVIVDFNAPWCGPCRQLGPILEKIVEDKKGMVALGKMNVDNNRNFAAKLGVQGIPDVRIFRDGKQVDKFVGSLPEAEVVKKIEPHLSGLTPAAAGAPPKPTITPADKNWLPPGMQRR